MWVVQKPTASVAAKGRHCLSQEKPSMRCFARLKPSCCRKVSRSTSFRTGVKKWFGLAMHCSERRPAVLPGLRVPMPLIGIVIAACLVISPLY
jgi:hypothetical protein